MIEQFIGVTGGAPLLAGIEEWRRMGDRFSGHHLRLQTEDIVGFVVVVALLGGLFVILRIASKWDFNTRPTSRPRRLSAQLAAVHGLSLADASRLRKLAAASGVGEMAELFVRPDLFHGSAAETVLEPKDLRSLRERLFGEEEVVG